MLKIFNCYLLLIEAMETKYKEMKKQFKMKQRHKLQRAISAYQSKRNEVNDEYSKYQHEMAEVKANLA